MKLASLICIAAMIAASTTRADNTDVYSVGDIEMINGVPTPEASERLFAAMDYYGAVLSYLWAMPAMGLKGWENANVDMGADPSLDGQISLYQGYGRGIRHSDTQHAGDLRNFFC